MVAVYPVSGFMRMSILQLKLTHRPSELRTRIGLCARTCPCQIFTQNLYHFISNHFHINYLQYLRTREAVRAISASSSQMYVTRMADCILDRYSNTLLVSLNNRISIRDAYSARGAVEVMASPSSSGRSETTADFLFSESEKQRPQAMVRPQTEIKIVCDRVISKSLARDLRFTLFFMPVADIV
jgi:hypothetical protein